MNIIEPIEAHALRTPSAPAILAGSRRWSFAQMVDRAARIAAALAGEGVRAGDVVGTALPGAPFDILILLALARVGAVAVVGHAARPWRAIAERIPMRAVIGSDPRLADAGVRVVRPKTAWVAAGTSAGAKSPHPGGERPWYIALTSGTTGVPRGVARTHAMFLAVTERQQRHLGLGPHTRFLCRMALHTPVTLLRAFDQLCAGGAIVFAPGRPAVAFADMARHRVTHTFVSPVMLRRWVAELTPGQGPLRAMSHLVSAGGELPPALAQAVEERITPNLFVSYGSAETAQVALGDPQTRRRHPDSVGFVVPWIEAQTVDERGEALAAGAQGRLRFRGAGVATSYHGGGAGDDEAFRDGWFYPGDVGRVEPDGLLYVAGRLDDEINLGGPKVLATEVERVLGSHPAVAEVAVFGVGTPQGARIVAAVVTSEPVSEAALREHYAAGKGKYASALRVVAVSELPRNEMGKVMKQELKARLSRDA